MADNGNVVNLTFLTLSEPLPSWAWEYIAVHSMRFKEFCSMYVGNASRLKGNAAGICSSATSLARLSSSHQAMDDFKAVYRIFKLLDACLDFDESSPEACRAERLGIAEDGRENPLWMMRLKDCADFATRAECQTASRVWTPWESAWLSRDSNTCTATCLFLKLCAAKGIVGGNLIAIWL